MKKKTLALCKKTPAVRLIIGNSFLQPARTKTSAVGLCEESGWVGYSEDIFGLGLVGLG